MALKTVVASKEDMKSDFWTLSAAINAAEEKLVSINAALSDLSAQRVEIAAQKTAIEADIGVDGLSMMDAKNHLASLARALSNVGTDPALAPVEEDPATV